MDLDATEIRFAQQLAANEKKQRDKSLKKLRKYLQVKSKKKGFTHEDFLRIWKGLHYCMWMQDKPLIHEELCTKVSQLVHDLANNESRWLFIKVFIITEVREWNGIDVWRLDKFMMMFRAMLTESLVALKNQNWKSKAVEGLVAVYSETMLSATEDVPFGLRSHFIDIFLDELNNVGGSKISAKLFMQILEPFIKLLQEQNNPDNEVSRKIIHSVFDPIVQRTSRLSIAKGNKKQQNGSRDFIKFPDLQIDGKMIADHLFDLSNTDSTTSKKRDMFYQIVKRLQDACDGIQPVTPEAPQKIAIPRKMVGGAVSELMKLENELNWKPTKKQLKELKKQKLKKSGKENTSEIIDVPMASLEEPTVRAGKKRKHSAVVDEDDDDATVTKVKRKVMDEIDDENPRESVNQDDNEAESDENKITHKSSKSAKAKQKKQEKLREMEAKSQNANKTTKTSQKDLGEDKTQKAAKDTPVANNVTPKPVKGKFSTPHAGKGKTPVKNMKTPQMANSKPESNKSGQWLIENTQDLKGNGEKLIETTVKGAVTKENQAFKDSLNSPIVPFNPTKTPDQSILKSGSTPATGNVRRTGRKVSADTPPSSLKSLKTPKRTLTHKTAQVKAAPVMSMNAALKKKVARDYFAL